MARGVDPALIGRTIAGKFTVESFMGAGAMGAVYKAKQVALDKVIALKVLHRELSADDSFTARFKREAKAASRLDHPNSVRVIDFGVEPDGTMYIAMELLEGRDLLRVVVDDWPLSAPRIASILMQALAALAVAHDLGIVHRDLKPENIMILPGVSDEGQKTDIVKVCDFGIAKMSALRTEMSSQGGGPLTGQGLVVGTPEYMSPEQGKGETLDPRSDLYSVGVILYQLLTGRVPFDAESALGIVFKHVTEEPVRPSLISPSIDRRLEAICLTAMRKAREDRYASARAMRAELRGVLGGASAFDAGTPSSPLGIDDTAPMPLMTRDRSSGILPDAASEPDLFSKTSAVPAASAPDRFKKTTSSVAALLEARARPARTPHPALLGFALVALASVAVAVLVVRRSIHPTEPEAAGHAVVARAEASPAQAEPVASAAPPGSAAAPSASAEPARATAPASPHPAATARLAPRPAAEAPSSSGASRAATFDLTTSSANPSVQSAQGATAKDVRAALPSALFTQCYRQALERTGKRLEGRMAVHLQMGADGRVTTALVSAPESLSQGAGRCITEAFNQLPVAGVGPGGGSADIQIVFLPE